MRIVRLLSGAAAAACTVAMAGPTLADDNLEGHYRAVVDGSTTDPLGASVLTINAGCDPFGNCAGWVSTPKTWGAAIKKRPGGSWTISRAAAAGWTCPDGTKASADLVYAFDATTLAGSVIATKAAGACGDPARPMQAYSLQIQQCVDDPNRGVCG